MSVAEAEARGAQAERDAVVTMLRRLISKRRSSGAPAGVLEAVADAIEAGMHHKIAGGG
jgi:hypothetical protein